MGLVKAMTEEQDTAGFSYWDNERVCSTCVVDEALARWVVGAGFAGVCSFCGTQQHHVVPTRSLTRPNGTNVVFFVDDSDHDDPGGLLRMYGEPRRHVAIEATTRWQAIEGPETAP